MNFVASHHFPGCMRRQVDLLLSTQQDHIRQRRLDRISNPPLSLRRRFQCGTLFGRAFHGFEAHQRFIAGRLSKRSKMCRIDTELTREGPSQNLVCRNESPQPLVDLTILSLTMPLNRLHEQQTNSHRDDGHHHQTQKGHERSVPGTEIKISHSGPMTSWALISHTQLVQQTIERVDQLARTRIDARRRFLAPDEPLDYRKIPLSHTPLRRTELSQSATYFGDQLLRRASPPMVARSYSSPFVPLGKMDRCASVHRSQRS